MSTSLDKPSAPISDWLESRAEEQGVGLFWYMLSVGLVGAATAIYDVVSEGFITKDFIFAFPIGVWFLSLVVLSKFHFEYEKKWLYSIIILGVSVLLSFLASKIVEIR